MLRTYVGMDALEITKIERNETKRNDANAFKQIDVSINLSSSNSTKSENLPQCKTSRKCIFSLFNSYKTTGVHKTFPICYSKCVHRHLTREMKNQKKKNRCYRLFLCWHVLVFLSTVPIPSHLVTPRMHDNTYINACLVLIAYDRSIFSHF